MSQEWFEMPEARKRSLNNAVWVPLRACNKIERTGHYGYLGYKEEFYGVGSLAVPKDKKAEADLDWEDIGISHEHGVWVNDAGEYIPSDTYKGTGYTGIPLVLSQRGNTEEESTWHLHQDLVIALGLKREGDVWVSIDEGYEEVARLKKNPDGSASVLEIRAEHLKDYLCARNMALRVSSYRSRDIIVLDASHIKWPNGKAEEEKNDSRWEGRVIEIHEGGMNFGAKTAVLHIGRTDVDTEEDVPTFGFPSDEQVEVKKWEKTDKGQKLYRILGALWRNEWVEPADKSLRIKRDKVPPTVFFITDASGKKESSETLVSESRWLWFKPDVITSLANRRGGNLTFYTEQTGSVKCSPDYDVHFGVNALGLVNVYAKDIGQLPEWQQRIWAGFNVSPDGGVSDELLAAQMKGIPADSQSPEVFLVKAIAGLNKISQEKFGFPLFREHADIPDILRRVHRFRALDEKGLYALAKDLARLTADSIDAASLQKIAPPSKGEKLGSLKSLERVLQTKEQAKDEARTLMSPLFGIYELRHADSHLPSNDIEAALKLTGINRSRPFVHQGGHLIAVCVSVLYRVIAMLKRF